MKLEVFRKNNKMKQSILIGGIIVFLLIAGILVYRSYAIYQEKKEFDVMRGNVPDQNYDVQLAFILEDELGNQQRLDTIPEGKNYTVSITCNDNSVKARWDYETWGANISHVTKSRTKCNITFGPYKVLSKYGIFEDIISSGSGLYEVSHPESEFVTSFSRDLTDDQINNLKQTEYRYAGANPNNYVLFNNELWRIIGLVNTPEGQRIKLIRNESIGEYSWDSSDSAVNVGNGVNEWSESDIMHLLNDGPYYNRSSGTCYNGQNNATTDCDIREIGLTDEAKEMIDTITWNIGSNDGEEYTYDNINTINFYNFERSNHTGKICADGGGNGGADCRDNVDRTTTWKGKVGFIYPSDYGYATSGGNTINRSICLNIQAFSLPNSEDCYQNNWLYDDQLTQWSLTSLAHSLVSSRVFVVNFSGGVSYSIARVPRHLFPTLYLRSDVKIVDGEGTMDIPYLLSVN